MRARSGAAAIARRIGRPAPPRLSAESRRRSPRRGSAPPRVRDRSAARRRRRRPRRHREAPALARPTAPFRLARPRAPAGSGPRRNSRGRGRTLSGPWRPCGCPASGQRGRPGARAQRVPGRRPALLAPTASFQRLGRTKLSKNNAQAPSPDCRHRADPASARVTFASRTGPPRARRPRPKRAWRRTQRHVDGIQIYANSRQGRTPCGFQSFQ